MTRRIASSLLGFWLAVSTLCWHHVPNRGFNDLLVGMVLFLSGACGVWMRGLRFFDAALGVWLLGSLFLVETDALPTMLHDGLLAFAVLILASRRGTDTIGEHDHWIREMDLSPRLPRHFMSDDELTLGA